MIKKASSTLKRHKICVQLNGWSSDAIHLLLLCIKKESYEQLQTQRLSGDPA